MTQKSIIGINYVTNIISKLKTKRITTVQMQKKKNKNYKNNLKKNYKSESSHSLDSV